MKTEAIKECISLFDRVYGGVNNIDSKPIMAAIKELETIENGNAAMEEALETVIEDAKALYDVTALDGLMDIIGVCKSTLDNVK